MGYEYNGRWWAKYAVVLALVALSASLMTLWDGPLPFMRVGTVGEWLAALGTLLAAYAAVDGSLRAQAAVQRTRDDAERAERRREREARVAAARSVVVADAAIRELPVSDRTVGRGRAPTLTALVVNGASTPVRTVRLHVVWNDPQLRAERPPDGAYSICSVLSAGDRVEDKPAELFEPRPGNTQMDAYAIRFFDIHGDEWIAGFGKLFGNGSIIGLAAANSDVWHDDDGRAHPVRLHGDWATPKGGVGGIVVGVDAASDQP